MNSGVVLTTEELSKKGYGIINGKLVGQNHNRQFRRLYLKKYRHNRYSSYCYICGGNTRTLKDDFNKRVCELCGFQKTLM